MATADIMARLGLDKSEFTRGISDAKSESKSLAALAGELKSALAGAFSVGAVKGFYDHMVLLSNQILDTAQLTGLTSDQVQVLGKEADKTGSSIDSVAAALSNLKKQQGLGLQKGMLGNEKALKAFQTLGITPEDLVAKDTPELLDMVAKKLHDDAWAAQTFAAASRVLGDNLGGLHDVLEKIATSKGLEKLTAAGVKGGGMLSESALLAYKQSGQSIKEGSSSFLTGVAEGAVQIGNSLAMQMSILRKMMEGKSLGTAQSELSTEASDENTGKEKADADAKKRERAARQKTADDARHDSEAETIEKEQKIYDDRIVKSQAAGDKKRADEAAQAVKDQARADAEHIRKDDRDALEAGRLADEKDRDRKRVRADAAKEIRGIFGEAVAPNTIKPVSDLNRIGGFVGGVRDARGEHAAALLNAQRTANRTLAECRAELRNINAKTNRGPEQL